jgi:hypothetical protein
MPLIHSFRYPIFNLVFKASAIREIEIEKVATQILR